jgi:Tol biopolymer transport system component
MCRSTFGLSLLSLLFGGCEANISGAPADANLRDAASPSFDAPGPGSGADDAAAADASPAPFDVSPDALVLGAWSTPTRLIEVASTTSRDDVTLSSNQLELFFSLSTGDGSKDLYHAARALVTDSFGTPVRLPFNSASGDETPRLSADDRTLYFATSRNGNLDVFQVTRAVAGSTTTWGTAVSIDNPVDNQVNTGQVEKWFMPCATPDGRTDHYLMTRGPTDGDTDLFEGTLGNEPVLIDVLSSPQDEIGTFVSADCKTIYFASSRSGSMRIYTAQRQAVTDPWPSPTLVTDFAALGGAQEDPWLSADQRTFAFTSDAGGVKDIYVSTR